MKLGSLVGACCALAVALGFHVGASQPPGKDGAPEVNIVLRVSRQVVNEVTSKKVDRTTPIRMCVLGSPVTGLAHTSAVSEIAFDEQPEATAYTVLLRGTSLSQTVVDKPPVRVFGSGRIDFTLRKRVTFDGMKFSSVPAVAETHFCSSVDGIAAPPGLIGFVIELIATQRVRRTAPMFAQIGHEHGKSELLSSFDKEVDKILNNLNEVSPLEKTVNTLFPETKDWVYIPRTTPTHLLVGVGLPGRKLPELPVSEKTNARIEMWIRTKPETQGMIAVLKLWRDASKQLEEMLPAELGKKLKLGEGFKTLTVKDWFVIQLGRDAGKEIPEDVARAAFEWRPVPAGSLLPPPGNADLTPVAWRPISSPNTRVVWRPLIVSGHQGDGEILSTPPKK